MTECIQWLPPLQLLESQVLPLSMDPEGCRLVQAALQSGGREVQKGIAAELKGHVCEMVGSPHGNHVLQRLVELMPPSAVSFVLDELVARWSPDYVAKHKFGCRVLERIIEHFPLESGVGAALDSFLERFLEAAGAHMFHAMATFILQHLLEYGLEKHKRAIVAALRADLERAAMDSHASGVLDKALSLRPTAEQRELVQGVLAVEGLLARMVHSNKAAAARLLLVATGAEMLEARRQLCAAFADEAQRSRAIRSVFESKSPPASVLEGMCLSLEAPAQESMETMGWPVALVAPSQQSMCMGSMSVMTCPAPAHGWWMPVESNMW